MSGMCNSDNAFSRRRFLSLAGAAAATGLCATRAAGIADSGAPPARKPNFLVILADDLGYGDLSVQGCKDIPTPNIDSLARDGVRFTSGYVSCPLCSPTRAGLMTGRYQQRFGHWYNSGPPEKPGVEFGLPLSEITIAQLLKQAGYATGIVGKWHLGRDPKFHPMQRGFDEFFGFMRATHDYLNSRAQPENRILRGTDPVDEPEYLTDAFAREAVRFIEHHQAEPFFLYLPFNAVHGPMAATPKYLERFPNIADPKRRTAAAMLSAMDDAVGAVLGALRKTGLEDNTLVFFLSDNGGNPGFASRNGPLAGAKNTILEGGIRVPFFLRWPGRVPHGEVYGQPVISLDVFTTCAAAAQVALPADRVIDGVDLIPYVRGEKADAPHDMLFWKWFEGEAARKGDWKLFKGKDGTVRLYDLSKDIGETTDVSKDHPDVVRMMCQGLAAWVSQLKPPLWEWKPLGQGDD